MRRLTCLTAITLVITALCSVPADSSPTAKNLVVTPAVRASLLDAGAAYHQLPVKDYVGLAKGMTYYALDVTTKTFYAAAGLDPSPKSLQAQVGAQDDGGYNLFIRAAGRRSGRSTTTVSAPPRTPQCPITIPSAVLKVWGWTLRCFPPLF